MDDDGLGHADLPIRVRIEVADGRLLLEFAGSSPQVPGNVNCTMSATRAAACYTIKALFDPDIPNNHGVIEVLGIRAEKGSIVDAVFPAAVASRAHTCQRIIDAIIGAFARAMPAKVVAAANGANTTAVFSGQDPRTGRGYVYLETLGGGFGGRPMKDGRDGVQVHITNTSNLPIEAIEMEYPLFVASYGFISDSGGAGRFRGGLGLRRVIEPLGHEAVFSGTGERFRHAPWGLFGGSPGRPGRFVRIEADGTEAVLKGKAADVRFGPGQSIAVETPGAGGFGPPNERSPDLLERDRLSGKFTQAYVQAHYPGLFGEPGDPATEAAADPAEPV
jgi:N-methylhydantoinase B